MAQNPREPRGDQRGLRAPRPARLGDPGGRHGRERSSFEAVGFQRQRGWERGTAPGRRPATRWVIKTNKQTSERTLAPTNKRGRAALRGRARPGAEERGSPGPAPAPPAGQTLTKGKRGCKSIPPKDAAGKQARPSAAPAAHRGLRRRARLLRAARVLLSNPPIPPSTAPAAGTAQGAPSRARVGPVRAIRRAGRGRASPPGPLRARSVAGEGPGRCPPPP